MKIERKTFSGIMNMDDPNENLPGTHHKEALNMVFLGNPGEMRAEVIRGNQVVSNTLPVGVNRCIGSYYDELKQRLFFFVYNSNGYDGIFVYNSVTRVITKLLQSKVDSVSTESLFDFSPDYPIASINIIYRTEADGDVLHWTDRNQRPMKLNIKDAETNLYSSNWKKSYLTVARQVPYISPICKYEDDATTAVNNLKNKVYQFRYRWVYRDFTKSVWSPYSRLFAPSSVDALANEINPTKNNRISIKYQTGDSDVRYIEICARHSIDTTFTDPFLVSTIDKVALGLFSNTEQEIKFYNNEAYTYVDLAESNQLFDYVPKKANAQELLNGNVVIYGGITEGVNSNVTMNVAKATSLVQNTDTGESVTMASYNRYSFVYYPEYNVSSGYHYIILNGIPNVGDTYSFTLSFRKDEGSGVQSTSVTISHTVAAGRNTLQFLEADLHSTVIANTTLQNYYLASYVQTLQLVESGEFNGKRGLKFAGNPTVNAWILDSYSFSYTYAGGGTGLPPDPTGVNTACYKHNSRYTFGICYFDEYGVTDGVKTTDNMKVIMPEIDSVSLSGSQLQIPMVEFTISHLPPTWAKYFSFVRTQNLTCSDFKTIITDSTGIHAATKYAYLDITSYQQNKSGYPAYSFTSGDRVRIIGLKNGSDAVYEYPVIGVVNSADIPAMSSPASVPADKIWIKIQYDSAVMSGWGVSGTANYYIEVITPSLNSSDAQQLFYEFGEIYPIITISNVKYHGGMIQSQNASQGAIFKFIRGDIYNRQRDELWILDKSMSDKYGSKISGNGRPFVIDEYAKETYYPTMVRYSMEYQSGTNINNTNRFYAANFDEYDRERGAIQRLKTRGRQLRVFQNRACGVVPILQSLVQTADGGGVLSQSAEIINNIQYYLGNYGIGEQYCGLASSAQADYFTDPVRGAQIRLSVDGMTSISELYKIQYGMSSSFVKYNNSNRVHSSGVGKAKILGFYDQYNSEFVTCLQADSLNTSVDKTLAFDEQRNAYTTFYTYFPEWVTCVNNLVVSWKNGVLYTHDNTTSYSNFYGVQNDSRITVVFNNNQQIKKRYNTITMLASEAMNVSSITNMGQESLLDKTLFRIKDDKIHGAFLRDQNSVGGLYNGSVLKGNWIEIEIEYTGSSFVTLHYIELGILEPFYNR
jgi:hypothetical protein